eukprot:CAMPEP_0180807256 /NCGR_PEP_ID=MMETSP1038_2-20121128/63140_1 /TAXON_ID=632150 /ORGANISM="Azadinium spinosum, Strain 3D9" /LENGTH=140 /DNA_ID=CAMNT_0022848239 /DNA_START=59 /DNA_END=477 /DNA_ORIENTATION=-
MCGKGKVPDDSVEETVEETKLPEKAAEAESEEPGNQEQVRGILQGLWVSGAAYGLVRLFATSERTEDIVDMAHSLVSSSMALFGFASMETHSLHMRASFLLGAAPSCECSRCPRDSSRQISCSSSAALLLAIVRISGKGA